MKTQSITFGLLLLALSLTSCKNSEAPAPEAPVSAVATTTVDSVAPQQITIAKDSLKPAEKEGKEENEANEKNEK